MQDPEQATRRFGEIIWEMWGLDPTNPTSVEYYEIECALFNELLWELRDESRTYVVSEILGKMEAYRAAHSAGEGASAVDDAMDAVRDEISAHVLDVVFSVFRDGTSTA